MQIHFSKKTWFWKLLILDTPPSQSTHHGKNSIRAIATTNWNLLQRKTNYYYYYYYYCYYCYYIASITRVTFKDHRRAQTMKRIVKTLYLSLRYIVCKYFVNRLYIVRPSSYIRNPSVHYVLTALASIPQFSQWS